MNPHWTPKEVLRFRQMWAAGDTAVSIAKELGKTVNAVCHARKRLELPPRKGAHIRPGGVVASVTHKGMFRETDAQARLWIWLLAKAERAA